MKKVLFSLIAIATLSTITLLSCEKDELNNFDSNQLILDEIESLTVEEYTADLAEFDLQEELDPNLRDMLGDRPCFKIIFPIKFIVPYQDAPVVIDSQEALKAFLEHWKNRPNASDVKPKMVFPIKVKLRNGDIKVIENHEQFQKLKRRCAQQKPDLPKFRLCFDPVFPLFVSIPTQNAPVEVNSVKELHELFKKWKANHPDAAVGPAIIFPIKIKMMNGNIKEVKNMEELKKYLKICLRKFGNDSPSGG
jgi:hypothetical protein